MFMTDSHPPETMILTVLALSVLSLFLALPAHAQTLPSANVHNSYAVGTSAGVTAGDSHLSPFVGLGLSGNWHQFDFFGDHTLMSSTANLSLDASAGPEAGLKQNGLVHFAAGYRTGKSTGLVVMPVIRLDGNHNSIQKSYDGGSLGLEFGAVLMNDPAKQRDLVVTAFHASGKSLFQKVQESGPLADVNLDNSESGLRAVYAFGKAGIFTGEWDRRSLTGPANLTQDILRINGNVPLRGKYGLLVGLTARSDKPINDQDSKFVKQATTLKPSIGLSISGF
jgi:hypothetical protein